MARLVVVVGVMASDQGQLSYINSYVHNYLLAPVAHRMQRDYSDGLCCQVYISNVPCGTDCMTSSS
jgi:hypothetical protein